MHGPREKDIVRVTRGGDALGPIEKTLPLSAWIRSAELKKIAVSVGETDDSKFCQGVAPCGLVLSLRLPIVVSDIGTTFGRQAHRHATAKLIATVARLIVPIT